MPIFRSRRDAELATAIYNRLPVLVDRSSGVPVKAWPVKYVRMFDITNDFGLFRTRAELEEEEVAWPNAGNRYGNPAGEWVPLYVGRMIHQFDHRSASVTVNKQNLPNPALSGGVGTEQKADPTLRAQAAILGSSESRIVPPQSRSDRRLSGYCPRD